MNSNLPKGAGFRSFLSALAVMTALLLVLFHQSLKPGLVLFANDAPLGRLFAQADIVWSNFKAYWVSLDWIGINLPSGSPSLTPISYALLGPVFFAKFHVPISLLCLGLAGWFFCRRAGFSPWVAVLTVLAAAFNSNAVSYACWGLPGKVMTLAMILFSIGLLHDNSKGWRRLLGTIVAGLCVGLAVMEGADVGAILSIYVALFAAWLAFAESDAGKDRRRLLAGFARIGLVAVCAGWIAAHALSSLIGTQIKGVAVISGAPESRDQRWEWATSWSFPKLESLRIVVPGLFGYRMDTPEGGAYWGGVGADGTPQTRFSGAGEYAGVLVVLVGSFAVAASLRRDKSPFSRTERRLVWFWAVVAGGSLLLAWGRFAPFYQFVFALPYFSTIRIPAKFLHGMHLALWILFAYGLEALARSYLTETRKRAGSLREQFVAWRETAGDGERRWLFGALGVLVVAVFAGVIYASSASAINAYIAKIQFFESPPATAAFSIKEVWLAIAFFAASLLAVGLMVIGWFSRPQARTAWWLLGGILVVDLLRANTPWVKHYDYVTRYQSNPVIDFLREQPWEHRVTAYLHPQRAGPMVAPELVNSWAYLQKEWLEHHFQKYQVQSLDIDQMPRVPELEQAYFAALAPSQGNLAIVARLWQLTNTRYVLASKEFAEQLNQMLDPDKRRFRVALPFALGLKPGAEAPTPTTPITEVVQRLTATRNDQGPFAVLEFTGALPRAKLFTDWQAASPDASTLAELSSPKFDPAQKVLLAEAVSGVSPGGKAGPTEANITGYAPKHITVKTKSASAGVLLLNDRWHPDWKVTVDGQPAQLLRAHFIMRGVAVPAGEHTVEVRFDPPHGTLWVSVSALAVGLILVGLLAFVPERQA